MPRTSSPAAVCWRGSFGKWPRRPRRGPCWGCIMVLRARLPARGRAGCCAAGTRGGAGAVLFPGHSHVCRGGGACLRVCRRGQRGRSGPLVYERRRAAGGRQLAVGGAACRAPRGGSAGGAGVQTAAACTQNARQARTNALTSGPKPPPRLPQSKKSAKIKNPPKNGCKNRRKYYIISHT